jgi:serine/threonine-protein kinase
MLASGDVVAGYRIERIIGQGGMGVVYEAAQLTLQRTVALKFLSAHFLDDVDFRERFRREGVVQAAIDHPHIVPVYEAGEVPQGLFLAMRMVRGPNLKELIVEGELAPARAIAILTQVAGALDAAHAAGLTHRDIKPQNVLVGAGDHGYLADFGLTRGSDVSSITKTGQFMGTLDYVAPELINGEPASSASDIYALTAVLYECLTGSVPYSRPSEAAVLFAHVTEPPPLVSEKRPDLPAELDDVIAHGMSKAPGSRPDSARALLDEAARALGGTAAAPAPPVEQPTRRAPTTRPQPEPTMPLEPPAVTTELEHEPPEVSTELDVAVAASTEQEIKTLPLLIDVDGIVADETAADETVADEIAADEIAADETVADEPVADETEIDETVADETVADETVEDETEDDETVEDETVADETAVTVPLHEPPPAPTTLDLRPPAEPAHEGPSPTVRRRRRIAAVAAVAALAVGAVVGVVAGGSGEKPAPEEPAGTPVTASSDAMAVTAPDGWEEVEANPRAIPGMTFEDPVAVSPGEGRELIAGMVDSGHPSLLAPGLRDRLERIPKRDDAVKLGDAAAYRYAGLAPRGLDRRLELLTVPTNAGVATVACLAPPAEAEAFAAACEDVAKTLELDGARPYALGPDPAFAKRLNAAVGKLATQRSEARNALAAADRPRPQADQATALARAFDQAANTVREGAASPAVTDQRAAIVTALRAAADRYGDLAKAADEYRRSRFTRARRGVNKAESRVNRALERLQAEGYRVG